MIRIVDKIYYTDLDNSGGVWHISPMIPASGRYKETSSADEHGRLRKVELSYTAPYITRDSRAIWRYWSSSTTGRGFHSAARMFPCASKLSRMTCSHCHASTNPLTDSVSFCFQA